MSQTRNTISKDLPYFIPLGATAPSLFPQSVNVAGAQAVRQARAHP